MRRIVQPMLLFFCFLSTLGLLAQPNLPDEPVPLPAGALWFLGAVLGGLGLWPRKHKSEE
jgi:hypothetical protein